MKTEYSLFDTLDIYLLDQFFTEVHRLRYRCVMSQLLIDRFGLRQFSELYSNHKMIYQ